MVPLAEDDILLSTKEQLGGEGGETQTPWDGSRRRIWTQKPEGKPHRGATELRRSRRCCD